LVIYMQTKILSSRVRPHAADMSMDPARDEGAVTCAAAPAPWNAASCLSSSATRVARAWRSAWSASRSQAPKRARDDAAPASGGLKALKAATDATAGALVQVKREKEALEDRLLCTICMEADAPRSVLFGPCNHYLACASCAAALAECPNCRATITTRTPIANSS